MMINKKLAQMMVEKPIKADVSNAENKLYLYGTIGDYWDGVTLDDVKNTARDMDKSKVTVYINSYGGDAVEGVAIRNFLKDTFSKIDVVIDGIAASSASIIATCGDTLTMPVGTTYMIHNPWTVVWGNRKEILKEIGSLESLEKSYRNVYMERFNGTEDELIELMDNESWLTAEEAESLGFATKIEEEQETNDVEPESLFVAKLVAKYAAEAEEGKKIDDNVDEDKAPETEDKKEEDLEKDKDDDKEKPNNLLQNFAKVFSNFE